MCKRLENDIRNQLSLVYWHTDHSVGLSEQHKSPINSPPSNPNPIIKKNILKWCRVSVSIKPSLSKCTDTGLLSTWTNQQQLVMLTHRFSFNWLQLIKWKTREACLQLWMCSLTLWGKIKKECREFVSKSFCVVSRERSGSSMCPRLTLNRS